MTDEQRKTVEGGMTMKHFWNRMRSDMAETWRASPNLLAFLIGLVPRRVWSVKHPSLGFGPGCETPTQAAEFIDAERENADDPIFTDEEREEYRNAPHFSAADLRRLWFPGAWIERNGWVIRCELVPRGIYGLYDWQGW